MKITLHTIPIRELVADFENNDEQGVVGYGGRLNIRPAYQREFVYNDRQQREVVHSIFKGFPLNVQIYICEDGTDQEQLDWFRIINIAGEKLTQQELRNAVYI